MASRRKAPNVPETSRKRVARTCDVCRKRRAKCVGGVPCSRCTELDQTCSLLDVPDPAADISEGRISQATIDEVFDERVETLEAVARHFSSNVDLSNEAFIRQNTTTVGQASTNDTQTTAAEARSSINAQRRLAGKVKNTARDTNTIDPIDPDQIRSRQSVVQEAATVVPRAGLAKILIKTFFRYEQVNYAYLNKASLYDQVDQIHERFGALQQEDAPTLCTLLTVLAIGTQYTHQGSLRGNIVSGTSQSSRLGDQSSDARELALKFYEVATTLVPDVIASATIESVRALLLLSIFNLPIDAAGLSYVYIGMAVRIAIQNAMHLKPRVPMDKETLEMRNRIWWAVHTLERMICVLNGRPTSIHASEDAALLPFDQQTQRLSDDYRVNAPYNVMKMIRLAWGLEDARDNIASMMNGNHAIPIYLEFEDVQRVWQDLRDYWYITTIKGECTDLSPDGPLFRSNTHLVLMYHLTHIVIGRNFIFAQKTSNGRWNKFRIAIASSCIEASTAILDLCQKLHESIGLASTSYIELTACRIAILAILAERMHNQSSQLKQASKQGLHLLKHTALCNWSGDAGMSQFAAIETAVRRLDMPNHKERFKKTIEWKNRGPSPGPQDDWNLLWASEDRDTATQDIAMSDGADGNLQPLSTPVNVPKWMSLPEFQWETYRPLTQSDFAVDFVFEPAPFPKVSPTDHNYLMCKYLLP